MFEYIIRRVLYVIPIGLGVTILVFALVHMSPGDPLSAVVPPDAPEEMVQELKKAYGFDKPLPVQYVTWLGRILTGDLGVSVARGREVVAELRLAAPNTFILAVGGTLLGSTLGAVFGGVAGYFQGRWIDKVATSFAITGVSVPNYWLGLVLAIILSAVFADLAALADPYKASMLKRLKPIGTPGYPLGADEMGRDMLTRLIHGGRPSLFMGISPIVFALVIGGSLGLVAGFLGGRVDMLIMRVMDVFYAFPSVLLAVAISGALGAGIGNAIVSLTLVFIPPITRVTESVTTQVRSLD